MECGHRRFGEYYFSFVLELYERGRGDASSLYNG